MKKRFSLVALLMSVMLLLTACSSGGQVMDGAKTLENPPALHSIEYDPDLKTLDDAYGADAFDHTLDHADSSYYVINDYYNMASGDGLHILSRFRTYQQTTEYSCACASALMVLEHYGVHDYNELDICRIAGTDTTEGTGVEGLVDLFESLGWEIMYHADTDRRFQSLTKCEEFFISMLDSGKPVMVDWLDWGGHWQVLIGLDTCGTDDPHDDVLIMADPYDTTDHYQDGYYIVPFDRFFSMWREGAAPEGRELWQQPFIVAAPTQD